MQGVFKFIRKNWQDLFSFLLIILSLILYLLPPYTKGFITEKGQTLFLSFPGRLKGIWSSHWELLKREERLSQLTASLSVENALLRERLSRDTLLLPSEPFKFKRARVIERDLKTQVQFLIIDRGERDGIKTDMIVIDPYGIVGKIIQTGPYLSTIETLLGPDIKIAAMDQRTHCVGLVETDKENNLIFHYVLREEKVREGDTIVTSGMGKVFPEGLRIGRVIRVENEPSGLFKSCLLTPFARIGSLQEVFIITQKLPISPRETIEMDILKRLKMERLEMPLHLKLR